MTVNHERSVRIRNRLGLHARPAAEFVKLAGTFEAEIWIAKGDLEVNGKSIMGVMMLAAEAGSTVRIRASGPGARAAADSLASLVLAGFDRDALANPPLAD